MVLTYSHSKYHVLNNVKKYRATFNSKLLDGFVVYKGNGSQCVFKSYKKGLYYFDMTNSR